MSDFNQISVFSTDFRSESLLSDFTKISVAGNRDNSRWHMDGQADTTKLIGAFRDLR